MPVHVRELSGTLARVVVNGIHARHDPAVDWRCAVAESGHVGLENVYGFACLGQLALFKNANVFLLCGVVRRGVGAGLPERHNGVHLVRFEEIRFRFLAEGGLWIRTIGGGRDLRHVFASLDERADGVFGARGVGDGNTFEHAVCISREESEKRLPVQRGIATAAE